MAISLASLRRANVLRPPVLAIYGVPGVGKTLLAASAPAPVFIQTEDGFGSIEGDSFGILQSYNEVMESIGVLYGEKHDFRTVVIDSLDHLEPMVWRQTAVDNGWKDIETPGWGKGFAAAVDVWRGVLDGLAALRDERNMTVIMLAHSMVKRFSSPESDPYDRYKIKLNDAAAALVTEKADAVLFANYRTSVIPTSASTKDKKLVRGVGAGDRVLHTTERPAWTAKNRFSMPDTLPMEWAAVAEWIPALSGGKPETSEAA